MYKEKDMNVGIVFKRSALGDRYVFQIPVILASRKTTRGKKYFFVPYGIYQNCSFETDRILNFDSKKVLSKLRSSKKAAIGLDGKTGNNNTIVLPLNDEMRNYVYEEIRKKGTEPSPSQFLIALSCFAYNVGKSIDYIMPGRLMSFTCYTKETPDEKNFPIPVSDEVLKFLQDNVFSNKYKKKIEEATAVAGQSYNKSSSTISRANPNFARKITVESKSEEKEEKFKNDDSIFEKIDPRKIKSELKKKIICQDRAIDMVVNNIYFNQRIIDIGDEDKLRNKASILLDGPTGTGKTFIIKQASKKMNLPFVVAPANSFSTVGYRGADITDLLVKLLDQANGDLNLAERGVVALDEFDKIGYSNDDKGLTMNLGVQQELLTFIEGAKYDVEYNGNTYEFDTSKLTIVAMGAFTNLRERKIKENEKKNKPSLGFSGISDDNYERTYTITEDDYIGEGLGRELVGRFSCLAFTEELGVEDLERILKESESSPLKSLIFDGKISGCNVTISDDVIHAIALRAYESNVGARGLNRICKSIRDIISNDLIDGVPEITITMEHLDKINSFRNRIYHERAK